MVGEDRGGARRVGQDAERVEVGHEPHLPDRPHALDRLQLVERVHRLHRDREPDAAAQAALEAVPARGLRADRPVVAAPEEADEADARLVHLTGQLLDRHLAGVGVGKAMWRLWTNSLMA